MPKKRRKKYRVHTKEEIWCSVCKDSSIISTSDVEELICGDCFGRLIYWEELRLETERVNYAKGWNLRKNYKAPDGKVFSFGEEITGDEDARNTKNISNKTKSVSTRRTKNDKQVLSKKNKTGGKKKRKARKVL